MSEPQHSNGPRAHSIIALGLTRETRRFLLKLNVRTVDTLEKLDVDYLACNGASQEIIEEIKSCLDRLDGQFERQKKEGDNNQEIDDLFVEELPTELGATPETERRRATCTEDVSSEEHVNEETPASHKPQLPKFRHKTLDELSSQVDSNDEDEGLYVEIAKLLLRPENRDLAIHSTSKTELREATKVACLQYEDALNRQAEIEFYYPMPLSELPLLVRTANILKRKGIKTVGDLCAFGEAELLNQRNAGVGTIRNVRQCLAEVNPGLVPVFERARGEKTPEKSTVSASRALNDVPFNASQLSVRAKHALRNGNLTTIGDILDLGEKGLMRLRNTGAKTVKEILDCANSQAEKYQAEHPDADRDDSESTSANSVEHSESQNPYDEKASRIRIFMVDTSEIALVSPLLAAEVIGQGISQEEFLKTLLKSTLKSVLEANPWGLTNEEWFFYAKRYDETLSLNEFNEALKVLSEKGEIAFSGETWTLVERTLEEAVNMHVRNQEWRNIVLDRLKNKTLQEIGETQGVTRERIRQITSAALTEDLLEGTRAGRYLSYMREYDLNEREVRYGLGASVEEWEAAYIVKKENFENDPAPKPAEQLLENKSIPARVRLALEKAIHYGYVKIGGEFVPERRLDLLLFTLKRYGSKASLKDEELIELYTQMLEQLGIAAKPKLQISERYMSNFRLQKCVLSGYWTRVRYYDFDKFDVQELIRRLDFEEFEGKEISTRLFLSTKPELLKEFEIEDAYELHSLLRSCSKEAERRGKKLPYTMTRRMPIIQVGKASREKQVIELAQELSPITVDEFAAAYEEEYGVEQATVKGDYVRFVSKYVVGDTISMDLEPFTEIERKRMASLFPGDYYRLSRFEAAYKREFPKAGTSRLNALSMRSIGFKVYSSCLLRDKWSSQNSFFDSFIQSGELFDEGQVPEDIATSHPYQLYIDSLVRERKLLPYEKDTWITEQGLKELGICESDMLDFATKAAAFCDTHGKRYCTAHSLKAEGFDHILLSYELSDNFYVTLLCTGGTRFAVLSCNGKKIACLDDARLAIGAFLEDQVGQGESIAVEDLIARSESDYGISLRRDKVIQAPSKSDLYYCPITDMIYKDRETFIKEVE